MTLLDPYLNKYVWYVWALGAQGRENKIMFRHLEAKKQGYLMCPWTTFDL